MTDFYTYIHCKPNGDPFYVGKGTGGRSHEMSRRSAYHKRMVAKYGVEVFVFPCESEEQAFADEIQQIAQLRREGYELVNLTDGGEGASGAVRSEETQAKHRAENLSAETRAKLATRTGIPTIHSTETRAKISAARKGKPSAYKGRKQTEESKARSRNAAKAQSDALSPEDRAKRASIASKARWAAQKDRTVSAEVRAKIAASKKGSIPWNKGIKTAAKNVTAPGQKKMVAECTESQRNQLILKE